MALPTNRLPRVVLITTVPQTLITFFRAQLQHVRASGFSVSAVSSPGAELDEFASATGVPAHGVAMTRELTPWRDLRSLLALTRLLTRLRPDVVHTHTPKAGLLGMLAAWLNRVPVRIYTINGLAWMTRSGWRRRLMQRADCLACKLSTAVLCVSESVRAEAFEAGICDLEEMKVLGHGGSHGVDIANFDPRRFDGIARKKIRSEYGLGESDIVISYVGRFVRDKGLCELIHAWNRVAASFPNLRLLLAGKPDSHDPLPSEIWNGIISDARIRVVSVRPQDMPAVYAAADFCVLPTHREGLPNVALEAGAMGIPMIACRVCGCSDAILHDQSGLLVELGDVAALAAAMSLLADDRELRARMGAAGRKFVSESFSEQEISNRIVGEYRQLLGIRHSQATQMEVTPQR